MFHSYEVTPLKVAFFRKARLSSPRARDGPPEVGEGITKPPPAALFEAEE